MIRHWLSRILTGLGLYGVIQFGCLHPLGGWIIWPLILLVASVGALEWWRNTEPWHLKTRWLYVAIWLISCAIFGLIFLKNPYYTLLVVFYGAGYDVGGLGWGKAFDATHRYPIFPNISPRKTWAGTLGGILTGWLCGTSIWWAYLPDLSVVFALLAIGFGSPIAAFGDLLASMVKRQTNLRHSGERLPPSLHLFAGHGGMIDRCLSIICGTIWLAILTLFFL